MKLNGYNAQIYGGLVYANVIHGETEGAIEAMKLAVSAGYPGQEDHARARLTLGNLYQNNGNLTQAQSQYRQILNERPNYPFANAALARVEAKKGNPAEAEKLLKMACDIIPEVGFMSI